MRANRVIERPNFRWGQVQTDLFFKFRMPALVYAVRQFSVQFSQDFSYFSQI